ncbi:hypothetical protein I8J38_31150, partial [Bacillus sp. OA1]|nr:hypothetical protein [Bacillus sp. OA1]
LAVVQSEAIASNNYNYMNLAEVQAMSKLKNELIDHIIVFENYAIDKRIARNEKMGIGFEVEDIHAEEQSNLIFFCLRISRTLLPKVISASPPAVVVLTTS